LVAAGWFIESVSTGQHVGWDGQRFLVPMVMAGGQRKMSGGGNAGCGGWFTHVGGGQWSVDAMVALVCVFPGAFP
jgi:hypothetical protein